MKTITFALIAIFAGAITYAANLERDDQTEVIQGPAYHGKKAANTTAISTYIDMRTDLAYSVYCAAAAKERWSDVNLQNYTTSAKKVIKASYVQTTIPQTTWHGGYINKGTPYLNLSGCAGQIRKH